MTQNMFKANRTPNSERPKGARNKIFRAEKQRRQAEALVRQEEHSALSPTQKLAKLDKRLGSGVGATRERERLSQQIAQLQQAAKPVTVDAPAPKKAEGKTRGSKGKKA